VFIVLGYDLRPYQKGVLLIMDESINVFGEKLEICGMDLVTGFYRDGACNPNKLEYEAYDGEINIHNVGDGNE